MLRALFTISRHETRRFIELGAMINEPIGEPAAETLFLIQAQLKNETFNRYVVDRIRTAAKMFAG